MEGFSMIKVVSSSVTITLNKLVKGDDNQEIAISPEMLANLEELVSSLLDDPSIVVDIVHSGE